MLTINQFFIFKDETKVSPHNKSKEAYKALTQGHHFFKIILNCVNLKKENIMFQICFKKSSNPYQSFSKSYLQDKLYCYID